MNSKQICGMVLALCIAAVAARADTLELKNGSVIKGKFLSGTPTSISFQVGSSVQSFDVADIRSLGFDSDENADSPSAPVRHLPVLSARHENEAREASQSVTIPAGTRISVRTIDAIDSTEDRVGDRFEASLEETLSVDGNAVVPKGSEVYGRLEESKESGTFTGRPELKLELTGIVVNGETIPLVTGEYEVSGPSKGASTAKRTIGGAAIGSIIGALAGGGKGAAIGAGAGAGVGVASETVTRGEQVRIPSETLLDFTLEQSVVVPTPAT